MYLNGYLPGAGQVFQLDYISLGLLVVALIFGIIFCCKGFLKAVFSLLIAVGSIVLATYTCKPLANLIFFNTPAGNLIYDPILSFVRGFNGGALQVGVTNANANTVIPAALGDLGVPEFLRGVLANVIKTTIVIPEEGAELAVVISFSIAMYALVALLFALISAITAIILKIILNLLLKARDKMQLKWFDRALGFVLGFLIGVAVIAVLSYFLIFVINMENDIGNFVAEQIAYSDPNKYTIAKGLMTLMNDIVSSVFGK